MKNIIGNKQKRYYRREVFRYYRAGFVLCLILVALLFCALNGNTSGTTSNDIKEKVANPVAQVLAEEDKYTKRGYAYCYDPLVCIRDVGEEMGFLNKDILIAIRIAKAESGLRPDAINKNSNGTFDIGTFQINDVHSKRISRQDRFDFIKNIKFAWTLRKEQGNWNAWSVCKSKVNCEI